MSCFAERFRQLRKVRHMTQAECGSLFGVGQQAVGKWEQGTGSPDYDALITIADHFNVTTDYLLGRTDIPNIYAHQVETADGKKSEFWDTQKDLSAAEKERMNRIAASAAVPNSMEELVSMIETIVNKVLDERKK